MVSMFCLCIFSSTFSIDGRSRSSRGLCWRSWTALGAYVGGLGPRLGPMLVVLGRPWGLCCRFWAALSAYVGGLGSGSGPKLAVWACLGAKVVGLGSGSGPKLMFLACLGAKAVGLGRGSGRKVALARAGKRSVQCSPPPAATDVPRAAALFFL